MAHITLSQLTTVLQRIVSWATGKFAAKNTYSGKIEYTDMPVVVLASMGSELDGTSAQRPMSAGSTYYLPAGQGAGARIMFVDSNGTAVKISNPESNVIYCNAYTGLLYRWDASESDMVPVGGDVDGLRKVYVDNSDFSSLDTLYSGVYQVIDQTTQRIIGVLVASSDNRFGVNPYFVTQWLFSNLMLSDEYSGSFNGYYTIGRAHIIHRFYNASNTSYSDIPLNTWSEWKVYGITLDEMSEIFNSKVSSISVNGTNHTPNSSGVVDLGTVITAHQDISGKANAADVPTKTEMADAIDDALGEAQVAVVPASSVGIISSLGSDSDEDALSASMGKKLKVAVLTILNSLGNYAFPDGKPVIDWSDDTPVTFTVSKTIGTGLSATGGDTDVALGDSLEVTIVITNNLYIIDEDSVVVTMGGHPVAGAWNASTMKVTIAAVTGNVVINIPSMTYVSSNLAFHLDCKNRGGQSGHWIDRIGGVDFKLTNVTEADSGMVFNGSSSKGVVMDDNDPTQEAVGTQKLDVAFDAGTIEVIATADSLPTRNNSVDCPLFLNPYGIIARLMQNTYITNKDQVIIKIMSATSGSTGGHYAVLYTGNTDIAVSLNTEENSGGLVRYNGVTQQNPTWLDTWVSSPQNTKFSIGYFSGIQGSQALTTYFKGTIKAIRVYKVKLTEAQMAANYKVDKKRFNLQ